MPADSTPWYDLRPTLNKQADKIEFIVSMLMDPCDAPITVWLQMMWKPLGKLLLAWYSIDLSQVLTAYLRPYWRIERTRSWRHYGGGGRGNRPGKGKGRFNPLSWDPNEFIGKGLHGWEEIEGFRAIPGEITFWAIEGVIERILFFWMVLDLGTDFLYEWTSSVAATRYCAASRDAVLYAKAPGYPLLGIFGWDTVGILDVVKERHILFFNGFGVVVGHDNATISLFATMEPSVPPGTPSYFEIRLRCTNGPNAGVEYLKRYDVMGPTATSAGSSAKASAFDTWIGEIRVSDAYFVRNPAIYAHAPAPTHA